MLLKTQFWEGIIFISKQGGTLRQTHKCDQKEIDITEKPTQAQGCDKEKEGLLDFVFVFLSFFSFFSFFVFTFSVHEFLSTFDSMSVFRYGYYL